MFVRKYQVLIVFVFMSIFAAKMAISAAPVFFVHLDKKLMNAVIMQLESENNNADDSAKANVKFSDHKLMFHRYDLTYSPIIITYGVSSSFIDHFRRCVYPYHPTVPTPPPNFS